MNTLYQITNKLTGEVLYFGRTKHFGTREKEHRKAAKCLSLFSKKDLLLAIHFDNLEFTPLITVPKLEAIRAEAIAINAIGPLGNTLRVSESTLENHRINSQLLQQHRQEESSSESHDSYLSGSTQSE